MENGYVATESEQKDLRDNLDVLTRGRLVLQKKYNYLNGRNIFECIDDWQKRWNGWIPPQSELEEYDKSEIFLNFTRNAIIGYLTTAAMFPPKVKISAVNKRSGFPNKTFAKFLEDLKRYSETNEVYIPKFLKFALAVTTDGTAYAYEGYLRDEQEYEIPIWYDPKTGKISYQNKKRTKFDDCYMQPIRLKDLYFLNPFEPDIKKQPEVLWRQLLSYEEAEKEFGHFKNWEHVKPGMVRMDPAAQTFYANEEESQYDTDRIEVLRRWRMGDARHVISVGNVVLYGGPNPFKDGRTPICGAMYEPYGIDFAFGMGFPQKVMGEQDAMNTAVNLMADKEYNSMLPYGLSSDLDDLIDDEVLQANRIRKVGDINKWKIDSLPGLTSGDITFLQTMLNFAQQFSGTEGGAQATTARGGRLQVRQVLMRQEEMMKKIGFSSQFLEDFERDRTELRVSHALQFYSIPKIEKITGKGRKEIEQLIYRDVEVSDVPLEDGRVGRRKIKLFGNEMTPDVKERISQELSVEEEMSEMNGMPMEALAVHVDTFHDYNYKVQVERYSSFEDNRTLEQAKRMEYANWRLSLANVAPINTQKLIAWVDESYELDTSEFAGAMSEVPAGLLDGQQVPAQQTARDMAPGNIPPTERM